MTTETSGLAERELMLSPAEIAQRVGVSIDAVRRAIRAGGLPAAKIFGRVRVHQRDQGKLKYAVQEGKTSTNVVRVVDKPRQEQPDSES